MQDTVKLGRFTAWLDDRQRSYSISGGSVCRGINRVDSRGNSVQVKRSGVVNLVCGESHSVLSVIENEPCVYNVKFETFLVCDEAELESSVMDLENHIKSFDEIANVSGSGDVGQLIEEGRRLLAKGAD